MAEKVCAGPVNTGFAGSADAIKEAVCIHTKKIMDACRDKDCIEDLRVYFTAECQQLVDSATGVRARSAELLYVYIDVESVPFNRGFYSVDVQFFYRVTVEAFVGSTRPVTLCGLATFTKRVLLFGSEGSAKIFSSKTVLGEMDPQKMMKTNMPAAYVEALDPVLLEVKLVEVCGSTDNNGCCNNCCNCCCCNSCTDTELGELPPCVCGCFEDTLVSNCDGKRVLVTLGQFSIIRLERDTQLLIPSYDYCIPSKDCTAVSGAEAGTACDIFDSISFPTAEFFPPSECELNDSGCGTVAGVAGKTSCGCCG